MRRFCTIVMLVLVLGTGSAWADGVNPDLPIEYIPFQRGNKIYPTVTTTARYEPATESFIFGYDLYFQPQGEQQLFSFGVVTEAEFLGGETTGGCKAVHFPKELTHESMRPIMGVITDNDFSYGPGTRLDGTIFRSPGLPGVVDTFTEGDVVPPSGQQVVLPPTEPWTYENSRTKVTTVGPVKRPEGLTPTLYAEYIHGEAEKALPLGWISSGILSSLNDIGSGQIDQAVPEILSLLRELKTARGLTITDEGYYLLKPNLERLLYELGYTPPRETNLSSIRDSILSQGYEHRNEGANSLLTLEEIQGKTTRSIIGFDLSGVDINSLSQATLVLTIDPSQQVTGWGNGSTVSVRAVTTNWTEGNGASFGLLRKDAEGGTGVGATWFTSIDPDITNSSSDSGPPWEGGLAHSTPPTAPSLVVTNHLTGELEFDVTQDLLHGAENGWLILKDQENRGSKVSFYSREGAFMAGDPSLAPQLLLEYSGQSSSLSKEVLTSSIFKLIKQLFYASISPSHPCANVLSQLNLSVKPLSSRIALRGSALTAILFARLPWTPVGQIAIR